MKKLKPLLLLLAVVSAALTLAACSCSGGSNPPDNGGTPTSSALSAPTLNVDEGEKLLTWNAVPNASGYFVQVDNGTPIDNGTSTSYSLAPLTAPAAYSLKVMAKGDGTNYTDSAWSADKTYTVTQKLAAPDNLQIDLQEKILTWDAVSNASGYSVQVDNGTPTDNGALTSFPLASLTAPAVYSIKVMAKGDNLIYFDSVWSVTETYTVMPELDAPANLQIDTQEKTLTWDAVDNASGYSVQVNDGTPSHDVTDASFSLADLTGLITYSITVKAYGDGTNYTDSPWSDTETYEIPE
ncbi:MAG: hypothetical protein LBL66_07360, partial [Clostridiales bacterium]|nr:hypothetical protein [Clostridiales bacterium]